MKHLSSTLLRLVPSVALVSLLAGGCAAGGRDIDDQEMYPDVGETKGALAGCGTALISWNGTTAYSNGPDTGTGESCAGQGAYGLRYQCVELVMRHFTLSWGFRWYGNAEDLLNNAPAATVDVYKNGDAEHPPVPGDMIVFGGGSVGHVALVTEVTDTSVTIIEQNVPSSFTRTLKRDGGSISPGWNNWWTMGWAHAKANGGSAGGGSPPVWSCGASEYDGQQYWTCENGDLHRCENGQPVVTECGDAGCTVKSLGSDDACISPPVSDPPQNPPAEDPPAEDPPAEDPPADPPADWSCADSAYNGAQYWTCKGGSRYRCEGGQPVEDACDQGCLVRSLGQDDLCISDASGWACAGSAYAGGQYWTCSGGDIYRCSGGTQQMVDCPSGCNVMSLGTDDTCK